MSRVLFAPFSVVGSLLAGFAARALFQRVWALIDEEEPPEAGEEEASWGPILAAAALQAAVFAITRAFFDRQARRAFRSLTGSWPGPKDEA